jgi:hypothetical protein
MSNIFVLYGVGFAFSLVYVGYQSQLVGQRRQLNGAAWEWWWEYLITFILSFFWPVLLIFHILRSIIFFMSKNG